MEPGVLAVQEVGVRDFRERLSELEQKNPFGDRFEPKPDKDLEDASDTAGGTPEAPGGTTSGLPQADDGGSGTPTPGTDPDDDRPAGAVIVSLESTR